MDDTVAGRLDRLAARLAPRPKEAGGEPVLRRWGTVDTVGAGVADVTVGGVVIPGVAHLASYTPVVGETVVVDFAGVDPLIVGARGDSAVPGLLARVTLDAEADELSVTPIPARRYLRLVIALIDSGSINTFVEFNNDATASYAYRYSANSDAGNDFASAAAFRLFNTSAGEPVWAVLDIVNWAGQEKLVSGFLIREGGAGAAALPDRAEFGGKWADGDQVSRVDVTNTGAGSYAAGSEVLVFGHD
jgi:hypothetical protein